jgi:hypothetical protein
MLFVVAWSRFNTPPTNRSSTTFALFSFGLISYYALIVALWLLVIIAVRQGSIAFDKLSIALYPQTQAEFAPHAPIMAAFVIVVAAYFPLVQRIDKAARAFCSNLAAIPREADRLTVELAQTADFRPKSDRLRAQITKVITENIGPQALNFEPDGSLAARFTRAVGLYWLFVGPRGMQIDFANANTAYARIMQLGEATGARVAARYEELMQAALAYFALARPSRELREVLDRSIIEVSLLTCSLIARYVLYSNATESKRRERLARMGFDAGGTTTVSVGPDQWVTTIFAVIGLSAGMMAFTPGMLRLSGGQTLMISIPFGLSIGAAVIAAVWVAQRFLEHHDGEISTYPPIAELTAAALIVAGFSAGLRIVTPLLPTLIEGRDFALSDAVAQFADRWSGVIIPFACTISLGLLCIYLGTRPWSPLRVAVLGALANGLALMAAAVVVAWLLSDAVLAKFYKSLEYARVLILFNSGLIGVAIGFMVLWRFKRLERDRREIAEREMQGRYAITAFGMLDRPPARSTLRSRDPLS